MGFIPILFLLQIKTWYHLKPAVYFTDTLDFKEKNNFSNFSDRQKKCNLLFAASLTSFQK